jgi:phenylpyruvate tautomerase PptA (4-oxalocrotonate tautomerase family)
MPTYVCSVSAGTLSVEQKSAIAKAICRDHSDATGAPPFFVQVVFEEKQLDERFLGGDATTGHIWIRGDIRAGRSKAQRGELMLSIMRDVSQIAGLKKESIWVYLCNLEPTDMVEYGHVLPAPGEEKTWFESLPESLREYLSGLGTDKDNFAL